MRLQVITSSPASALHRVSMHQAMNRVFIRTVVHAGCIATFTVVIVNPGGEPSAGVSALACSACTEGGAQRQWV